MSRYELCFTGSCLIPLLSDNFNVTNANVIPSKYILEFIIQRKTKSGKRSKCTYISKCWYFHCHFEIWICFNHFMHLIWMLNTKMYLLGMTMLCFICSHVFPFCFFSFSSRLCAIPSIHHTSVYDHVLSWNSLFIIVQNYALKFIKFTKS